MYRLCVTVLTSVARPAGDKVAALGTSDPAGVPVEARLVAKKTTYKFDLGGKSPAEFRQALADAAKSGKYPPAPFPAA